MYTYSGVELLGQTISVSGELVYPHGYIILCFHSNVMGILVPHLYLVTSIFKFSHSADEYSYLLWFSLYFPVENFIDHSDFLLQSFLQNFQPILKMGCLFITELQEFIIYSRQESFANIFSKSVACLSSSKWCLSKDRSF